ncbi:MAG: alkaline phosphatase family protein [Promethearchaeota archaeon]|nr:MAG: alkaline phosphatase family protein [Candidatus Lokiarchaeota archaeon]
MNNVNRLIYIIIDNLRAEHFFDFIKKGLLPNFKKLMENGIYSENCITDFPPITYPTQVSLITGTYTGDYRKELCHGIPLLNWMGRDVAPPILREYASLDLQIYKINKEMGTNCKTILEMLDDGNTASIAQFINRGAAYIFPERKSKLAMYYLLLKYYPGVKRRLIRANSVITHKLIKVFEKPYRFFENSEPPICSLLWFPTPDLLLHRFGYDSEFYKLSILHIDKVIGVLIDALKRMGYFNETAIAIISDHGNYKADKVGNLGEFFKYNRLSNYHPKRNLSGNMDLAYYAGAGFFYFKGFNNSNLKNGWYRPSLKELEHYGPKRINLLEDLFKINGSRLMFYCDDQNENSKGIIHLKRKIKDTGKIITGRIEYEGSGMEYKTRYISDNDNIDIFGFINDNLASRLLDNRFHSTQEWLEATYHLDYPLHPDLIPRHFKNPRSADIIITNDESIKFGIHHGKQKSKNLYDHDIGFRSCMTVPIIIGGSSEIPQKKVNVCKITDIVPTLLKLLGKKPHQSVIGECLF